MIEDHNPYAVLGVAPVATAAEINHAFRAKLRDVHPDTRRPAAGGVAGDTQLQRLIAAYHLLRDPEDRARYDHNARTAARLPRGNHTSVRIRHCRSTSLRILLGPRLSRLPNTAGKHPLGVPYGPVRYAVTGIPSDARG